MDVLESAGRTGLDPNFGLDQTSCRAGLVAIHTAPAATALAGSSRLLLIECASTFISSGSDMQDSGLKRRNGETDWNRDLPCQNRATGG